MANDRKVRGGILNSDRVNSLSWAEECFYRRLLSLVDDYGNYDGRLDVIRADAYPLKLNQVSVQDVEKWLDKSVSAELVRHYEVDGKSYIHLLDFNQTLKFPKRKYPVCEFENKPPPKKRREEEIETEVEANNARETRVHPLQVYVKENFKNISYLKSQLTFSECEKLCTEFKKQKIADVLNAMENKKDLTKKYISVNLTLRNWLKNDFEKQTTEKKINSSQPEKIYTAKTLEKYIGAEVSVHATKKRGIVDRIIGDKLHGEYYDGEKFSVIMKEVFITASAPRRNMAEVHISELVKSFQK